MERGKEQQQIQELVTFLSTMDDVGVTDREMTLRENGVWNYQGGCHTGGRVSTESSFESHKNRCQEFCILFFLRILRIYDFFLVF